MRMNINSGQKIQMELSRAQTAPWWNHILIQIQIFIWICTKLQTLQKILNGQELENNHLKHKYPHKHIHVLYICKLSDLHFKDELMQNLFVYDIVIFDYFLLLISSLFDFLNCHFHLNLFRRVDVFQFPVICFIALIQRIINKSSRA